MLVETLKSIVGPRGWIDDDDALEPHLTEWRGAVRGKTLLMVMPASTQEVSELVKACAAEGVAIVPQGGNTGMCAGAVPDESGSQVLLNLSRMNRVREVNADDFSMIVEAGCILEHLQNTAAEAGRFFPLSLGAEGSCQIGGNLATNAGGINVLRYGTARQLVLGIEVVLADGTIWDGIRTLRKDTAGYDLKQLFIGSEGTLGVITAAALRLFPCQQEATTILLALPRAKDAISVLAALQTALPDRVQAFELISGFVMQLLEQHIADSTTPFDQQYSWYVLLELTVSSENPALQASLAETMAGGLVHDAVIAKNMDESERLWRMRHSITEAEKKSGPARKHDISVPIASMAEYLARAEKELKRTIPACTIVAFGHVGDGNLHYNVMVPENDPATGELASRIVYDLVAELGGSCSAEHGIGRLKSDILLTYKSDAELALMRKIKAALDPDNLMNPGKVLPE